MAVAMALLSTGMLRGRELGPPYNPTWEDLRPDERVRLIDGPPATRPDPIAKPGEQPIDGIAGYKSVRFGDTIEMLADRLRRKRAGKLVTPLERNETYVLRDLYPGEETYGGLPVGIRIKFVDGRVFSLEIAFLSDGAKAFELAFREKYGPPNAGATHWRGSDVEFWIEHGPRGGVWVQMKSLKVENEIRSAREAERKRQETEAQQAAKRLKRDF